MTHRRTISDTDAPIRTIDDDLLGIAKYCSGTARYISECKTPMTLSIQGPWGSGKTSMMRMMQADLPADKCISIAINTWQYSYASDPNSVPLVILADIAKSIADRIDVSDAVHAALDLIQRSIRHLSLKINSGPIAALAGIGFEIGVSPTASAAGSDATSVISSVQNIIRGFKKLVSEATHSEKRLVIFIDDLDRLAPARAVDVLECLKVFVDTANCVFIIAVDFEVVELGIEDRYRNYESFDEKKSSAFFEKIIQVPLQLPVERYETLKLVQSELSGFDYDIQDEKEFAELASCAVGRIPRSIKRLMSTFGLLLAIHTQGSSATSEMQSRNRDHLPLFGILALQVGDAEIYAALTASPQLLFEDDFPDADGEPVSDLFDELSLRPEIRRILSSIRRHVESQKHLDDLLQLSALSVATPQDQDSVSDLTPQDVAAIVAQHNPKLGNFAAELIERISDELPDVAIRPQSSNSLLWTLSYKTSARGRGRRRFGMITVNESGVRIDLGTSSLRRMHPDVDLMQLLQDDPTASETLHSSGAFRKLTLSQGANPLPQFRRIRSRNEIAGVVESLRITERIYKELFPVR